MKFAWYFHMPVRGGGSEAVGLRRAFDATRPGPPGFDVALDAFVAPLDAFVAPLDASTPAALPPRDRLRLQL